MKTKPFGFTLIELMVVILIVAVLAAAVVPLMWSKIDRGKWTEANASAGTIRNAVKVYFLETGDAVTGTLSDAAVLNALTMNAADLAGTYFTASDYAIDSVTADGT
ncbi:MAG: prepilin-type N-terminal cleavage/methylation domain-containing protein, partial [Planctomycetales bacterium]|nr:prepilin-type N-terminal cleavage/methylation domain-containing protein [Planctomycetales bacterium]